MFPFLRHIGFPPFKSTRRSARPVSSVRTVRRWMSNEPLEGRLLMAADAGRSLGSAALFAALSRGGDALMAHAGYDSTDDTAVIPPSVVLSPQEGVLSSPAPTTSSGSSSTSGSSSNTTDNSTTNTTSQIVAPPVAAVPVAAVAATPASDAEGEAGDVSFEVGQGSFVIYNSNTGALRVETTTKITTLSVKSKSGIFTGSPAQNLGNAFDVDSDDEIFKIDAAGFSSLSFGNVAKTGLTEAFVRQDIDIEGSPLGGGVLGNRPIRFTIDATNLAGTSVITTAKVGDEFLLRVRAKDTRATSLIPAGQAGIFSAYLDITYDSTLADPTGTITYNTDFNQAAGTNVTDGLLDEVGAVSSKLTPTGSGEITIFTVKMKATKAGNLVFAGNPADQLPANETTLFGRTASINPLDINFVPHNGITITGATTTEARDLVAFAKALAASGAKFYGAGWCPHCTATKELFEDGQSYLPFIEVTNADRTPNQIAIDNNISSYPTWKFANGKSLVGEQTLEKISSESGIAIPTGNLPTLKPLDDVTLLTGSPLWVSLDGWDPNKTGLTYTVTSDNPAVTTTIPTGNRNLQVDVEGFGKMLFQLFDDKAPRATNRITELAGDNFYDGLKFHRVLNNFVIQGGDPKGDGTGGSDLPDFDDQFHVDLQHNRSGLLSMAKSSDDTNNSQFFITEGTSRHLDFNHTIFGVMTEGESNRDNISNTAVNNSQQGKPTIAVTMRSIDVVNDNENAIVMLKAAPGTTGTANITVKARDAEGNEVTDTFKVTLAPDNVQSSNGSPFLNDIPEQTTTVNTPVNFQLTSQDVEGDAVTYSGENGTNLTLQVNPTTGAVVATPKADFIGTATARVIVKAAGASASAPTDEQLITVKVLPGTPTVDLAAASDTGVSNSDNITNADSLQFVVSGVSNGATVKLFAGTQEIGSATATGTSVTITTTALSALPDGAHSITARQTVSGESSAASTALSVTVDQTAPVALTSTAPTTAAINEALSYNAQHPEEGTANFRYSLTNGPTGATIDPSTGVLSWTPTSAQAGTNTFSIVVTDAAGNTQTQAVSVNVEAVELMKYRLQFATTNGTPTSAVANGQSFVLQVYVQDVRAASTAARGVFAAYLDVNYPQSLVEVTGPITYGSSYPNAKLGSTTTAGLINDAGAQASTTPLGGGEFLLFSVPMKAKAAGTANFTSDKADESPLADTTLFGLTSALRNDQMVFGAANLQVVNETFAVEDSFTIQEDSAATNFSVLANDIAVPETVALTITAVTTPAHGTATRSSDNKQIIYTPTANYQGDDTFTYTIRDDNGKTSTATVKVKVNNVNDAPTANDDTFTLTEDTQNFVLNVLSNDSFAPDVSEVLTITATSTPGNGTVAISADKKQITYSPTANFSGTDTFTYTISDGNGGTDTGQISITVTAVNDAPVVTADTRTVAEDGTLNLTVADLLANDNAGPGESTQTLTIQSVQGATNGTVTKTGDQIQFKPTANFVGTATFTYTVQDNGSPTQQATGTVTITVTSVNDPPTAVADTATAQSGAGSITIDVLANDTITPDTGETLSIKSVGTTSNGGTVSIVSGKVQYTPANNYSGTETFTYIVADGNGGEAQGTVTVTVQNFVPGGVTGFIFVDSNNDGVRATNERALAGVAVRLTGTDTAGKAVNLSSVTDATGKYAFAQVAPGNYTVTQDQPAFTVDGKTHADGSGGGATSSSNSFTLQLGSTGNNGTLLNFAEQSLEPKFSIWDALASGNTEGFYTCVHSTGGQQWTRVDGGWQNSTITNVRFNSDMTAIIITIKEGTQTLEATVPRTDRAHVQSVGRDGNNYLFRIKGDRSDFNFQAVSAST